jgi:hypothetical protein
MSEFPHRNLPLNAALAGATTLIASAASTHAAILHYDANISVSNTATNTLYLNVNEGVAATTANAGLGTDELSFTVGSIPGAGTSNIKPVVTVAGAPGVLVSGTAYASPVAYTQATKYAAGDGIATPSVNSADLASFFVNTWPVNSGPGYLGFSFQPADTTLYGWAQLDLTEDTRDPAIFDDTIFTLKLLDFAYDDSGATLNAGAIPEPSSAAMLAAALAGSATLFRRRQAKQAVA